MSDDGETFREAGRSVVMQAREELERRCKRTTPLGKAALRILQAADAKVTKLAQKDGEFLDSRDLIDHKTRLAASDMILQLYDAKPSQKVEGTLAGGLTIKVIDRFEPDDPT